MSGNEILFVGLLLATPILIAVFARLWIWPGGKLAVRRYKLTAVVVAALLIVGSVLLLLAGQLWLAAIALVTVPLLALAARQQLQKES